MLRIDKKLREYYAKGIAKAKRFIYRTEKPIYNLFKRQSEKKALISYITAPFKLGISYKHNNSQYVLEIAKLLDTRDYTVDIMDFRDSRRYDFTEYDLIIGFGEPFNNSYSQNSKAIRIYYGTIMNTAAHNSKTVERLVAFKEKYGVWLPESARIEANAYPLQTQAVDAIVAYGNSTIHQSYKKDFSGPIYPLHNINFIFRDSKDTLSVAKDWDKAKLNFCTFPAAGLIHKGIDVVLELFAKHPEWTLYLAGPLTREPRFLKFFEKTLKLSNIKQLGFVDMSSPEYLQILDRCAFFLSPSASEGCPTSVINACTNSALIPIATAESGLEDNASYVVSLSGITEDALEKAINNAQALSNKKLETMAKAAHKHFYTAHSKQHYIEELSFALDKIITAKSE